MTARTYVEADDTRFSASTADVEETIPRRFAQMVELYPEHIALGSGDWRPTYAGLDGTANVLALRILQRGGDVGDRVAVLMRHDAPQIAAVMAILKAGRVVVVANPSDPLPRLRHIIGNAGANLVLTDTVNEAVARQISVKPGGVLLVENTHTQKPAQDPGVKVDPKHTAFLVYTSGSTGEPKGIMQNHRNVLHNVWRLSRGLSFSPNDRILLPAALSGGHGVATMSCALMNGAALCPFPVMERGVIGLAEWINKHQISVFVASASLFRHFVKTLKGSEDFSTVRVVRLGSEMATAEDFRSFQRYFPKDSFLFHTFSSSETGNVTQAHFEHGREVSAGRLPVGFAAEGMEVLLLDESGSPVPAGEPGEIVVRSRYLSPGYWRNPAFTAQRFSTVNDSGGLRQYRTADLGRFNEQGELVYLGRKDAQVKIRGYRVELSEVEDALVQQPEVERAAVCLRTEPNGDARLVAYVVPLSGQTCIAGQMRRNLSSKLPSHMVPAAFVLLDELPLTPHGKVDREKLRTEGVEPVVLSEGDVPGTEMEALLAEIWCKELKCGRVTRQSDFFALGGDSLSAAVVAARIHALLKVELNLPRFFTHSRLKELAADIDRLCREESAGGGEEFFRVSRDKPLPLSFAQERTWRAARNASGPSSYTMAASHRIRGLLRVDLLRECIDYLGRRHEILRTTFREIGGNPAQIVHEPAPVPLPLTDLSNEPDAEKQAAAWLGREARQPFDLAQGPLLRMRLIRLRDDEYWLLRTNHHIISDGWSWKVYFRELALLYEARLKDEPSPLPEFEPLQYADYAAWQRRVLDTQGRAYQEAVNWWAAQFAGKPRPIEPRARRFKRARRVDSSDGLLWWGLEPALSQRLEQFGRSVGATYYGVRLAAFAALLAHESGHPDILLGTYVTNRTRVESQNMFGFFSNPATLRLPFDPSRSFLMWLSLVREMIAQTQARGEIPHGLLREELLTRGVEATDARTMFTVSDNAAPVRFGGLELTAMDRHVVAPGGFCLTFDQYNEASHCRVVFDAGRYHPAKVRKFVARYVKLMELVLENPNLPMIESLRRVSGGRWLYRMVSR